MTTRRKKELTADTMTSPELAAHRRGGGILLLPVGCFEMHDRHVGLSCDTFLAEAACRVLAEEWDAVILPPIVFTYPGATTKWPGSCAIRPRETLDYIVAVVKGILRNGSQRLVLVGWHGPNGPIVQVALRQVFEETGELPILFMPNEGPFYRRIEEEFGRPHGEAAWYLASLEICGRADEFDPAVSKADEHPRDVPTFESFGKLARHGVSAPYVFVTPWSHVGWCSGLTQADAPRLAEIYREWILDNARGLPEDYEEFRKDMAAWMERAPWDEM
jgi:hypothetical protein